MRLLDLITPPCEREKSERSELTPDAGIYVEDISHISLISPSQEGPRLHPRLRTGLVRELWPVAGSRRFLLDTTVRSTAALLDACPAAVHPNAWRVAVTMLARTTKPESNLSWQYDDQPVLAFRPNPPAICSGPDDSMDDFR